MIIRGIGINYKKLYKTVDKNLTHNNFRYKLNANNTDINELSFSSEAGGLCFTDEANIHNYLYWRSYIVDVKISDDEIVYCDGYRCKAKTIYICNMRHISDFFNELSTQRALDIINKNLFALEYVDNRNIFREIIKNNGLAIRFIHNQTKFLSKLAVRQNGLALQYINDQTHDICIEAVKQNGLALQYVKNQTHDICIEAIKQNNDAVQYVKTIDEQPTHRRQLTI